MSGIGVCVTVGGGAGVTVMVAGGGSSCCTSERAPNKKTKKAKSITISTTNFSHSQPFPFFGGRGCCRSPV